MSKSVTHWYAEYPGDYARKTAHLSLAEHGAYLLLRHHYYSTGRALPANASVLHRVCSALADEEKAAVQSVLDQFFTLEADGYHNTRCDEELAKRMDIKGKRQAAAEKMHADRAAKAQASADANAPALADTPTPTPTVREEGGGDARDGHSRVLLAAGIDSAKDISGKWHSSTALHTVRQWRGLGLSLDEIVAEVESIAGRSTGPPGSLAYFTPAMQRLAGLKSQAPLTPLNGTRPRRPSDAEQLDHHLEDLKARLAVQRLE